MEWDNERSEARLDKFRMTAFGRDPLPARAIQGFDALNSGDSWEGRHLGRGEFEADPFRVPYRLRRGRPTLGERVFEVELESLREVALDLL